MSLLNPYTDIETTEKILQFCGNNGINPYDLLDVALPLVLNHYLVQTVNEEQGVINYNLLHDSVSVAKSAGRFAKPKVKDTSELMAVEGLMLKAMVVNKLGGCAKYNNSKLSS